MRVFSILFCFVFLQSAKAQELSLQLYGEGFSQPIDISHAGDERLFITEKAGVIRILNPDGSKPASAFLDIRSRVNAAASERGLLGLCFHPDYKQNGYFFVHYTNSSGNSTISRFSVTGNPNIADPNTEKIILVVNQPFNNHNAGDLEFGPDGYLYIGMGDGGSGGDPGNRSQNPKNLLGKMLRLDINTDQPYLIPADNPWVNNADTLPEIWALGLRNPWRFSFDRMTGDMWIGDVGQNKWEEINYIKNGTPAVNYGWRCYEGFEAYNNQGCQPVETYTMPVYVYRNPTLGCSVTGGFVYRGPEASRYHGQYIFTDYCSGRFWTVRRENDDSFTGTEIGRLLANQYVTFGEDRHGNLFVAGIGNGRIYKFSDPKCEYMELPEPAIVTPITCYDSCDASIQLKNFGEGVQYQWSHGPDFITVSGLCPGNYSVTLSDDQGCRKTLQWDIERPLELSVELEKDGLVLTALANQQVEYQWYKDNEKVEGAEGSTLVASGSGTYFVVVINAIGCAAQSLSVQVIDCSYLESTTLVTQSPATCHDSCDASIQLQNTSPAITYTWSNGLTGNVIDGLCPGEYSVLLSDDQGCLTILEMKVDSVPELTVEIFIADIFLEAFANEDVQFQWFRNGEILPGATKSTFEADSTGEYYVIVTNEKGCTAQSITISVTIISSFDPTAGNLVIRCRTLHREGIQFQFDRDVTSAVTIFDVAGRVLHDEKAKFSGHQWHKVAVSGVTDGVCFIHFVIDGRQYVHKVFLKL